MKACTRQSMAKGRVWEILLPLKLPVNAYPPCHSSQESWDLFPLSPLTPSSHMEQNLFNSNLPIPLHLSKSGLFSPELLLKSQSMLMLINLYDMHMFPCFCPFLFSCPTGHFGLPAIPRAAPWCSPLVSVSLLFPLL